MGHSSHALEQVANGEIGGDVKTNIADRLVVGHHPRRAGGVDDVNLDMLAWEQVRVVAFATDRTDGIMKVQTRHSGNGSNGRALKLAGSDRRKRRVADGSELLGTDRRWLRERNKGSRLEHRRSCRGSLRQIDGVGRVWNCADSHGSGSENGRGSGRGEGWRGRRSSWLPGRRRRAHISASNRVDSAVVGLLVGHRASVPAVSGVEPHAAEIRHQLLWKSECFLDWLAPLLDGRLR